MIVSVKGNISHYLPLVLKGMDLCFQNSQYKYIGHHKQIPVRLYQKNTSGLPKHLWSRSWWLPTPDIWLNSYGTRINYARLNETGKRNLIGIFNWNINGIVYDVKFWWSYGTNVFLSFSSIPNPPSSEINLYKLEWNIFFIAKIDHSEFIKDIL